MRGKILLSALQIIKDCALTQTDFFEAVIRAGYGASMSKIDYEYDKIQNRRKGEKLLQQEMENQKKRFRNFLYQMKHDKLIQETGEGKFKLSLKGKERIKQLKNRLPERNYTTENQNNLVIKSFDVPERLRRKRNWLREVIKNLGFNMIHQSVWMGKKKIPEQFIKDLAILKLVEFVEIFEVTKQGSLRKLIT